MNRPLAPLVVAFAADDLFAMPLAAAARSVLDQSKDGRRIELVVLDGGISRRNRGRIERSLESPLVSLRFLDTRSPRLRAGATKAGGHAPYASYTRLLLPDLLPGHDRVLYLDADVIVRHDPGDLFDSELDGASSLGVVDPQGSGRFAGISHLDWRAAGADPTAAYVNTGVLLMDLERWRSLRLTEQCTTMIERHGASFEYSDQDAINLAHATLPTPMMGITDPRWNVHAWVLRFEEIGEAMYDPETLKRTIDDPWIIHYTNNPKPWRRGCTHPWKHEFYDALDRTDWRGWRVSWRTDAIPTVRRAVARLRRRVARSSR